MDVFDNVIADQQIEGGVRKPLIRQSTLANRHSALSR
jgi:hypothetical protein